MTSGRPEWRAQGLGSSLWCHTTTDGIGKQDVWIEAALSSFWPRRTVPANISLQPTPLPVRSRSFEF